MTGKDFIDEFTENLFWDTDIQELDAQIIREFVEKILVFKTEKVDGRRVQRIRIIYNCIGAIDIPEQDEKTA